MENYTDSHQEYYLDRWIYYNGKLFDTGINGKQKVEHMYLHFINWKVKMQQCELKFKTNKEIFYISYTGIRTQKQNIFYRKLNNFKNVIYGFWIRENIRVKKKKFKKRLKRVFYI